MKLFPKENKNKTTKVEMGTLYDINKTLISKLEDLTIEELQEKKEIISDFIFNKSNKFYMMLCNERKDYTVFSINDAVDACSNAANILIDECLVNRGRTKAIDLVEDGSAIEIWLSIDDELFCYYLFPYDTAIIEC